MVVSRQGPTHGKRQLDHDYWDAWWQWFLRFYSQQRVNIIASNTPNCGKEVSTGTLDCYPKGCCRKTADTCEDQ